MVAAADTVTVSLWGQDVGAATWLPDRGLAAFEYFPEFLSSGLNVSPVLMRLEESRGRIYEFPNLARDSYFGLPGLLADALPDKWGNAIIDEWLTRQGRSRADFSPIERLCYIGSRGMGALEFRPALSGRRDRAVAVDIRSMASLVHDIISHWFSLDAVLEGGDDELGEAVATIFKIGTSAGGARAKAVIAINEENHVVSGQGDVPAGYVHHLIKFDGVDDERLGDPKGYGIIEYVYHQMATRCGIEMTPCFLMYENGRAHFVTQRFDRRLDGKVHMLSLCGMAHFDFNMAGAYSYEQAFQVMRQLRLPYTAAEQLYRRMLFNVVARNQDDHTKNIAFLMDQAGKWALSPAYDVTFSYRPDSKWVSSHQMSINGKRDEFTKTDLIEVGDKFNIRRPTEILSEVVAAVSEWQELARAAKLPESTIKPIQEAQRLVW
jgi:serine/threonine-protein kinase HipA